MFAGCPPEVCLLAQDQSIPEAVEVLVEYRRVPQAFQGRRGAVLFLPLFHQLPGCFRLDQREPDLCPVQPVFQNAVAPDRLLQGRRVQRAHLLAERLGLLDEICRAVPQQPEGGLQRRVVCWHHQGTEEAQRPPNRRVIQEVLPPGDKTGNIVVAEAFLHQLQLPVGAAEHRNIGKGPHRPLVAQGLGLQHVHAAGHTADLLGDEYGLGEAVRCLDQSHGRTGGAVGSQYSAPAGIMTDHCQGRIQNGRSRAVIFC